MTGSGTNLVGTVKTVTVTEVVAGDSQTVTVAATQAAQAAPAVTVAIVANASAGRSIRGSRPEGARMAIAINYYGSIADADSYFANRLHSGRGCRRTRRTGRRPFGRRASSSTP